MFEALYPHPEDRLQLRLHRARSVILTSEELVEIRAAQRTFEGAYMRTALSQFSFALVVLKIFTAEFYAIGALFAVYGAAVMLVAIYRRYEGNRQFFSTQEEAKEEDNSHGDYYDETVDGEQPGQASTTGAAHLFQQPHMTHSGHRSTVYTRMVTKKKFRTSGNSVAMLSLLSISAYITLIVLLWRLQD
ncbi:uncharacterized protein SPSK_03617 [Sporothrix schenckii 1099-18]|uniref:DUF202 domain-containing protein n=2 Tax=Sporothrix schenckii TaxID=29908 RepID=U7PQV9_SPOS1|nr:uncharacterized protein SPSK_03617 [Sporothrix schenckii 1099-18]ERS97957.1 hypothetical protein HMPREF1624_06129 [Sporothrix schenckii ATCC 58251]KJR82536.1 hypothetical protein SPSK_03617 [Sporothrix schenckii 1099-18]